MKKVLALLLVLCMVFSLAACSSDENKDAPTPTAGGTEVTTPTENNGTKTTPEPTPTDEPVVVIEDKDVADKMKKDGSNAESVVFGGDLVNLVDKDDAVLLGAL